MSIPIVIVSSFERRGHLIMSKCLIIRILHTHLFARTFSMCVKNRLNRLETVKIIAGQPPMKKFYQRTEICNQEIKYANIRLF